MRALLVVSTAMVLGVLGWRLAVSGDRADPVGRNRPSPERQEPPTTTVRDGTEVFRRAFWRTPAAKDRILHAERREWADDEGVARWDWFLEVEPSAELRNWLQQDNPFALVSTEGEQAEIRTTAGPRWFPESAEGYEIHQSADRRMSLLFSRERNVLFGTASGHGFAPGAPAAKQATPVVKIETTGRLPLSSPPNPKKQ